MLRIGQISSLLLVDLAIYAEMTHLAQTTNYDLGTHVYIYIYISVKDKNLKGHTELMHGI